MDDYYNTEEGRTAKSLIINSILYGSLQEVIDILHIEDKKGRDLTNVRFDDGRFDDGRFDDGRFDDGRFDDGPFRTLTPLDIIFYSRNKNKDDIFEYLINIRGADWTIVAEGHQPLEKFIADKGYVNMVNILEEYKKGLDVIKPAKLR